MEWYEIEEIAFEITLLIEFLLEVIDSKNTFKKFR